MARPECNYYIAPTLKNVRDWARVNWKTRPSTANPSPNIICRVCVFVNLHPLNKPEARAHANSDSFDGDGNLVDDKIRQLASDQMRALVD
jgi:chromate reductase, NAD(P)H dehydrogenase (quinone)